MLPFRHREWIDTLEFQSMVTVDPVRTAFKHAILYIEVQRYFRSGRAHLEQMGRFLGVQFHTLRPVRAEPKLNRQLLGPLHHHFGFQARTLSTEACLV